MLGFFAIFFHSVSFNKRVGSIFTLISFLGIIFDNNSLPFSSLTEMELYSFSIDDNFSPNDSGISLGPKLAE